MDTLIASESGIIGVICRLNAEMETKLDEQRRQQNMIKHVQFKRNHGAESTGHVFQYSEEQVAPLIKWPHKEVQ